MTFATGTKLGSYEVLAPIGAGDLRDRRSPTESFTSSGAEAEEKTGHNLLANLGANIFGNHPVL